MKAARNRRAVMMVKICDKREATYIIPRVPFGLKIVRPTGWTEIAPNLRQKSLQILTAP